MTDTPDFILWPLKLGDTLSNHDWFPLHGHKLLGSRFVAHAVMEGRRADIGTNAGIVPSARADDGADLWGWNQGGALGQWMQFTLSRHQTQPVGKVWF